MGSFFALGFQVEDDSLIVSDGDPKGKPFRAAGIISVDVPNEEET